MKFFDLLNRLVLYAVHTPIASDGPDKRQVFVDKLGNGFQLIESQQEGVGALQPDAWERYAILLEFLQILFDLIQWRYAKGRILVVGAESAGIMGTTGRYLQENTVCLIRRTYNGTGKMHDITLLNKSIYRFF